MGRYDSIWRESLAQTRSSPQWKLRVEPVEAENTSAVVIGLDRFLSSEGAVARPVTPSNCHCVTGWVVTGRVWPLLLWGKNSPESTRSSFKIIFKKHIIQIVVFILLCILIFFLNVHDSGYTVVQDQKTKIQHKIMKIHIPVNMSRKGIKKKEAKKVEIKDTRVHAFPIIREYAINQ